MATTLDTRPLDVDADAYHIVTNVALDFPEEILEFAGSYARQRGDTSISLADVQKAVSQLIKALQTAKPLMEKDDPQVAAGLDGTISLLKRIQERCDG